MKILFPLHTNGFDLLNEDERNEAKTSGEEMLCKILYLENSDKAIFYGLKKHVKSYYVLNKSEYPRTFTAVQSLLLNYHNSYNSNDKSQYHGVNNQLMFKQHAKTWDDDDETKY